MSRAWAVPFCNLLADAGEAALSRVTAGSPAGSPVGHRHIDYRRAAGRHHPIDQCRKRRKIVEPVTGDAEPFAAAVRRPNTAPSSGRPSARSLWISSQNPSLMADDHPANRGGGSSQAPEHASAGCRLHRTDDSFLGRAAATPCSKLMPCRWRRIREWSADCGREGICAKAGTMAGGCVAPCGRAASSAATTSRGSACRLRW